MLNREWIQKEKNLDSAAHGAGFALSLRPDGRLWLRRSGGGSDVAVTVQRCFPWSQPLNWLSLRDADGREVELLENIDDLDPISGLELKRALEETAFVFLIQEILRVEEQFELRQWTVRILQRDEAGEDAVITRIFQTKLSTWPRELPSGGLLIQDVGNDLYLIAKLDGLDAKSAKILWAFLDD